MEKSQKEINKEQNYKRIIIQLLPVFNRPGVAGAVLQTPP